MPPSSDAPLPSVQDVSVADIDWRVLRLESLRPIDLLRILRARQQVFVVEQHCPYLDADVADEHAWHLAGWHADRVCAYARIIDPGVNYPETSIGRVITDRSLRGLGLGRALMARAVERAILAHPGVGIRISAQAHLQAFYAGFGFEAFGDTYLEDDIPHIAMRRQAG